MARIIAPNKTYNGISAGVKFTNGEAECSDKWTIKWFKEHGYSVEEAEESKSDTDNKSNEIKVGDNTDTAEGASNDKTDSEPEDNKQGSEAKAAAEVSEEKSDTTKPNVKPRGRRKAEK